MTQRLVGYCRVSTDNQKEEGTIEIQERALAEYAKNNGYELVKVFKDDGVSGGLEARPGLAEMFSYLESENSIHAVLIYKLDRIARDLYIQELIVKKLEMLQKTILSVKERDLDSKDPMRKAFRQFMGIVAELEKAFITMRLSGGRLNKARKGGYSGGRVPLGYIAENKNLEIDANNLETIRTIFRLRRKKVGLRDIARHLNTNGYSTARGGSWYAGTVRYIVRNRIYRGRMTYKNIVAQRKDLKI